MTNEENEEKNTNEDEQEESEDDVIEDDRETKKIKTENGHEAVVYTYLTGRDERELKKRMFESMDQNPGAGADPQEAVESMGGDQIIVQDDVYIEAVVKSIDGKKDNIVDRLLDLRSDDYREVMDHVEEVSGLKEIPGGGDN